MVSWPEGNGLLGMPWQAPRLKRSGTHAHTGARRSHRPRGASARCSFSTSGGIALTPAGIGMRSCCDRLIEFRVAHMMSRGSHELRRALGRGFQPQVAWLFWKVTRSRILEKPQVAKDAAHDLHRAGPYQPESGDFDHQSVLPGDAAALVFRQGSP